MSKPCKSIEAGHPAKRADGGRKPRRPHGLSQGGFAQRRELVAISAGIAAVVGIGVLLWRFGLSGLPYEEPPLEYMRYLELTRHLEGQEGLTLPESTSTRRISDWTAVTISPKVLRVKDRLVAEIDEGRVPVRHKNGGSEGYLIRPLRDRLAEEASHQQRIAAISKSEQDMSLLLIVDRLASFRVLTEVIYSARQAGFMNFDLMVSTGSSWDRRHSSISIEVPAVSPEKVCPRIALTSRGITVAASGRIVSSTGGLVESDNEPTIPRLANGEHDYAGLTSLLESLKAEAGEGEEHVVINAEDDIPFFEIIQVLDVSREADGRVLFPRPMLSGGM